MSRLLLGVTLARNKTTVVLEAASGGCDIYSPVDPLSLLLTCSVSLFFFNYFYHFDESLVHRKH